MAIIVNEPAVVDFRIYQGEQMTHVLTVEDDGAARDLSGYTAEMDVRATADSTTEIVTFTTTNGRLTLGGAAGTITFVVPSSVTASLTLGRHVYDLKLINASTNADWLLKGYFIIERPVTRT